MITSELRRQSIEHITSAQCSERLALTGFEYDVAATDRAPTPDSLGTCTGFTQRLNLVADAADATAPKLVRTHPLPGWSWSTTLHGSDAYVASGEYGVTHIDLAP